MTSQVKRAYHSPRRTASAQATRQRILLAARTLFAARGYSGTTLETVAAEAGVAIQTVRQVFGGKSGLMRAQLDVIDQIGGIAELRAVLDDPVATPSQMSAALARFLRRLYEGAADVIEAARNAGGTDPELRALLEGGLQRHRSGVAGLTAQWGRAGALRRGLTAPEAAAIVASVASHEVYRTLRLDWRWSTRRYEKWLAEAVERLVLDHSVWSKAGVREGDTG